LLTLHNLRFYLGLMARIRAAIAEGPAALAALRSEADRWMSPLAD
jgi:queuine/archaeosine tRNA-ribosyltransferase